MRRNLPLDEDCAEAVLGAMREGVLILDRDSIIRYANPAACQILAMPAEQLLGTQPRFAVPDHGTTELALPGGTILDVRSSEIAWRTGPARLIGLQDLTAQRRLAAELRQSEDRYRLLAQHIPGVSIHIVDRELRFIAVEGSDLAPYERSPADLMGRSVGETADTEILFILEPMYRRALAGEECELVIERGGRFHRINIVPVRDQQGDVFAGMAMSLDITSFKRIEQDIRALNQELQDMLQREQRARAEVESQRALLHDVMAQAPTMMCVHQGPEHVYLYVNDIYCAALGRPPAALLGRPAREAVPEIVASGQFEVLDRVYATGEPFHASELLVPIDLNRNGTLVDRYFTFSYQPMRDTDGKVTGLVVDAIDVTESVLGRRALEQTSAEISRLNRDLERRVAERTAELMAANQELEAFAYSVSHDLRAPLRRIDGYSRALLEDFRDKLDDTGWHYLSRIRVATQHMGEIIDDLLALAKVARQELEVNQVSLSDMARRILEDLQEQSPERQVEVCIEPAMIVRGDARLLRLAMENLLENAWKFTSRRDQAMIEIGVQAPGEEPDSAPVFFVRDNGAGFDPAFKSKLFSTFNRLHSPLEFPGTGIGLATVKRVLDRHGGRIWAEGEVGKGAVFYFTVS